MCDELRQSGNRKDGSSFMHRRRRPQVVLILEELVRLPRLQGSLWHWLIKPGPVSESQTVVSRTRLPVHTVSVSAIVVESEGRRARQWRSSWGRAQAWIRRQILVSHLLNGSTIAKKNK